MTAKHSVFFDEWQACLRAHYVHVIRANDTVTERTLRHVLLQSGLSEADLDALWDEAAALGPLDPQSGLADRSPVAELPVVAPPVTTDEIEGDEEEDYDDSPDDDMSLPSPGQLTLF